MKATTIYRIYTEKKNRRAILRIAGKRFESFTLQPAAGYYKGKSEESIVIEIVGASERAVNGLAAAIRRMNGQKSVLVLKLRGAAQMQRA